MLRATECQKHARTLALSFYQHATVTHVMQTIAISSPIKLLDIIIVNLGDKHLAILKFLRYKYIFFFCEVCRLLFNSKYTHDIAKYIRIAGQKYSKLDALFFVD